VPSCKLYEALHGEMAGFEKFDIGEEYEAVEHDIILHDYFNIHPAVSFQNCSFCYNTRCERGLIRVEVEGLERSIERAQVASKSEAYSILWMMINFLRFLPQRGCCSHATNLLVQSSVRVVEHAESALG
jgi:hypothetical protein